MARHSLFANSKNNNSRSDQNGGRDLAGGETLVGVCPGAHLHRPHLRAEEIARCEEYGAGPDALQQTGPDGSQHALHRVEGIGVDGVRHDVEHRGSDDTLRVSDPFQAYEERGVLRPQRREDQLLAVRNYVSAPPERETGVDQHHRETDARVDQPHVLADVLAPAVPGEFLPRRQPEVLR